MFKEHPIFIPMHIASTPICSPVVDQDPVTTPNNEPNEDVDLVTPDEDLVTLDVVMDITLRRSKRACRPTISYDYIVYLQKHEYDVDDVSYPTTYKEAISSPQSNF